MENMQRRIKRFTVELTDINCTVMDGLEPLITFPDRKKLKYKEDALAVCKILNRVCAKDTKGSK